MCGFGNSEIVSVKVPADLSYTGKEGWKNAKIDKCIAPLVRALQKGGIDMRGSCCGHGKVPGHIELQDGRGLFIIGKDKRRNILTALCKLYLKVEG